MVRRHELRATDGSQNEVQGPNLAGAFGGFALALATVSGAEIRNRVLRNLRLRIRRHDT